MDPPNLLQQRALAYAPKPFAALSFFSSSFVIYYLLVKRPEKRKRMYHRLVLTMNMSVLPQAIASFWGTWAIPKDTPYYAGASGTVQTCTAQGFLSLMFTITLPFYYASLSIFSFLAVKNNFHEAEYKWIEKWIHAGAYGLPLLIVAPLAAREGINPNGSGCFGASAPPGCENDPDISCERGGGNLEVLLIVFGLGQVLICFIIPPVAMLSVRRVIHDVQKKAEKSIGMRRVIESSRKHMMKGIALQIRLYLFSFWFTYIFGISQSIYKFVTGQLSYNLLIPSNCILSSQGFILTIVYFKLQSMAGSSVRPSLANPDNGKEIKNKSSVSRTKCSNKSLNLSRTVSEIRRSVKSRENFDASSTPHRKSIVFSIFDGTPSNDSPWAQYIDEDSDDEMVETTKATIHASLSHGIFEDEESNEENIDVIAHDIQTIDENTHIST